MLTLDAKGEFTATMLGEGRGGEITIIEEILNPDSMGYLYSAVTEFLGFRYNDGEFKVMGMSAFGDSSQHDLSQLIQIENGSYRINDHLVWLGRSRPPRGPHFPA